MKCLFLSEISGSGRIIKEITDNHNRHSRKTSEQSMNPVMICTQSIQNNLAAAECNSAAAIFLVNKKRDVFRLPLFAGMPESFAGSGSAENNLVLLHSYWYNRKQR